MLTLQEVEKMKAAIKELEGVKLVCKDPTLVLNAACHLQIFFEKDQVTEHLQ